MAVRLLIESGKGWAAVLSVWVVASAVLPILTLVALGSVVSRVPAAARLGLGSPAGHRLVIALVIAGVFFAGALLVGPAQTALSSSIKVRLTFAMQRRLMAAVSGPVGIAHLENPDVLDRLAGAQGSLMSYYPADAPVALAGVIGTRLSGLIACGVLASFRWWVGVAVLFVWLAVRRPLRRVILDMVRSFSGNAEIMRRAQYFLDLAIKPAAAKELRVFALGSWVVRQFRAHWIEGMAASWKNLARMNRVVMAIGAAVLVVYVGTTLELGHAVLHHQISLQKFTVTLLMVFMASSVGAITFADIGLEFMVSSLPNLHDLEAALAGSVAAMGGTRSANGLPERELRFERVTFSYPGSTTRVIDHLDLVLPAGRSTAIVGLNGAGKTTLVKLLSRLHDPTTGQITVDGATLTELDPRGWQRQVAVVFQDFNRYPLSAADNVALGAVEHQEDAAGVARAIERAGAGSVVEALPFGIDTILSRQYEGGTDISGGQWQRMALARALFAIEHGARVLVLDEPTAWLDARGEAEFFERFLEITVGVTTVVISHRFSTVRRADRICVLDGGRVTEEGTHDQLLLAGGTYASMFRMQAARFDDAEREDGQP